MKRLSRYVQDDRPKSGARPGQLEGRGSDIDWTVRLDTGEQLLWSGRPDADERPKTYAAIGPAARWTLAVVCGGLVLVLLFVFLPVIGTDGLSLIPILAMIAVLLFGLWYMLGGQTRWNRYWRSRTRYALTDRRAIIARRALWRYWTMSIPVAKMTPARLVELGGVAHVIFKEGSMAISYSTISQGMVLAPRSYRSGFLFLKDAAPVHRRLVALQSTSTATGAGETGPTL